MNLEHIANTIRAEDSTPLAILRANILEAATLDLNSGEEAAALLVRALRTAPASEEELATLREIAGRVLPPADWTTTSKQRADWYGEGG